MTPTELRAVEEREPSLATRALHADRDVESVADIAPPLHVSTTFAADHQDGFVYARQDQPTRRRLEAVLGALDGGVAVTWASGQAAVAAVLEHCRPKRVLFGNCYHGTLAVLERERRRGMMLSNLDSEPSEGDLIWLETPMNPTCELHDIRAHVKRAQAVGASVAVDSTFATPIWQRPLALGARYTVHSTSKFLSGHSDALGGVVIVGSAEEAEELRDLRTLTGAVMGTLEAWLTLRGVRTLDVRIKRQTATASLLAAWLEGRVRRVWHPSLSSHPGFLIAQRQMDGPGAVLAFELESEERAREFPSRLRVFRDATSLGGVESLVEWRKKHDPHARPALVRLSVGLEAPGDLIADLEHGLYAG